ncbi:MAG: RnfABCDGE type electron transport complex subunit D [Alkalispirochaetaceae bacterium]
MSHGFVVSMPPHERSGESISTIMWGVAGALLPALIAGVYFFGIRALVVTLFSVIACIAVEYLVQRYILRMEETTALDGSAAVTGMLLAFNVPSSIPLWQILVGAIVSIGIAKMAFGGIGNNPFNPALIGRAFMLTSFPVSMTTWPVPGETRFPWNTDAVTGATPLGLLKESGFAGSEFPGYLNMFLGNQGGCIGEISALAVLIGGLYMLYRGWISWQVPILYLGSLALITGLFWAIDPAEYADPLFHILAGGAMIGAWFMATDMTTSPMSIRGKVIFAVGGGLLAGLIRLIGGFPEGVSYSILLMNAAVPMIDKYVKPRTFGKEKSRG